MRLAAKKEGKKHLRLVSQELRNNTSKPEVQLSFWILDKHLWLFYGHENNFFLKKKRKGKSIREILQLKVGFYFWINSLFFCCCYYFYIWDSSQTLKLLPTVVLLCPFGGLCCIPLHAFHLSAVIYSDVSGFFNFDINNCLHYVNTALLLFAIYLFLFDTTNFGIDLILSKAYIGESSVSWLMIIIC